MVEDLVLPTAEFGTAAGRPMLALHGAKLTGQQWGRAATEGLPERRWICPDLRGQGSAPAGSGPWTISQLAADLVATLDALEVERTDLVGHSLGGRIAMEVAQQVPDRVSSLVLLDPPLMTWDQWIELRTRHESRSVYEFPSYEQLVAARIEGLPAEVVPHARYEVSACLLRLDDGRARLRADPAMFAELAQDPRYVTLSLGDYRGEVLLVVAGRSHAVTSEGLDGFRSPLGSRLTTVRVEDSGHDLLWHAFEQTVTAIRAFLEREPSRETSSFRTEHTSTFGGCDEASLVEGGTC